MKLDCKQATGFDVRSACRSGRWTGVTSGLAPQFAQANLVVIPQEFAFEFLLFCQRNPKPCPIVDVTDPGDPTPRIAAPSADLRTDLPRYRIWRDGILMDEPLDIVSYWRDDLVSFLLGCSFTFESALMQAGVPIRHLEQKRNVPMYRTNIECGPAGRFRGPLVVSMRPMSLAHSEAARQICAGFPHAHGEPIHTGDPKAIGIRDLANPEHGDAVDIRDGEVPVFWACGVTPQAALQSAKLPFAITHAPGHMFLTDLIHR